MVKAAWLPDFPFSGYDLYHHFRNVAVYDLYNLLKVRKTGKQEVVFLQPLPQTLYDRYKSVIITHNQGLVTEPVTSIGYDHVRLLLLDHDHFCNHPSDQYDFGAILQN